MPISELATTLSDNRLHVVVFGPGYGESIAVHVPDGGWLVCDSLSGTGLAAGFVPAVELLSQRQETAAMLLLTHPHDDHVAGFDRLVTGFATGPVGLVGLHLAHGGFGEDQDAQTVLATSNRLKALASVARYWRERPEHKWELVADGTARELGPARVEVLHPNAEYLTAGRPDPASAPNAYSTPVLVEWESARIVLGADVPSAEWNSILGESRPVELADHMALKVSHHGSFGSIAEELVRTEHRAAAAAVTPWQLGRGLLPKLGPEGGLQWLLERRASVGLTSTGRALTRALSAQVTREYLLESVERRVLPGGSGVIEVKQSYDPDVCWIALTYTSGGVLESMQLGTEARVITRD
jgi:beta-lactamase superfamily II metal-dependent hydrolase